MEMTLENSSLFTKPLNDKITKNFLFSINFTEESMFIRARSFGDREIYRKAQAVATPSCDLLQRMQNM